MIEKIKRILKISLLMLISIGLMNIISIQELSAKSKNSKGKYAKVSKKKKKKRSRVRRHYNPDATRAQAMGVISTSDEIASLAGIEGDGNTASENPKSIASFYEPGEDLAELELEDDVSVDMDSFKTLWLASVDDSEDDGTIPNGISKKDMMDVIMDWIGTPYHFGGLTDRGIDCSAFVQRVYKLAGEVHLPRTAQEQFGVGKVIRKNELQFGDMVFFHTRRSVYASHVGIYLGDNLFAHSSSRYGVTVSTLESTFYDKRFIGARRLSAGDLTKLSINKFSSK